MSPANFKIGDWVRVIGVPPNLTDEDDMKTRTLFEKCVGRVFPIYEIDQTDGMLFIGIEVVHVVGRETYEHTIYIEPEYVEAALPGTESAETESS